MERLYFHCSLTGCLSVSKQNSSYTEAPILMRFWLIGCLLHWLNPYWVKGVKFSLFLKSILFRAFRVDWDTFFFNFVSVKRKAPKARRWSKQDASAKRKARGPKRLRLQVQSMKPEGAKRPRMLVRSTKSEEAKGPRMRAQRAKPEGAKRSSSPAVLTWRGIKWLVRLISVKLTLANPVLIGQSKNKRIIKVN